MELIYIQHGRLAEPDNVVETTCPNCGAPITGLWNMRCAYCRIAVTPVNRKVRKPPRYCEVDYHHV